MTDKQELANMIYEAANRIAHAFYENNQKEFTRWQEVYSKLTDGMTSRQAEKLAGTANLEFRQSLEGLWK